MLTPLFIKVIMNRIDKYPPSVETDLCDPPTDQRGGLDGGSIIADFQITNRGGIARHAVIGRFGD